MHKSLIDAQVLDRRTVRTHRAASQGVPGGGRVGVRHAAAAVPGRLPDHLRGAFAYSDRTRFTERATIIYENPDHSTEVYPYDEQGRPLTGVRLMDQYGQPVRIGSMQNCDTYTTEGEPILAYPMCNGNGRHPVPTLAPLPGASATPSAPSSPTPTAPASGPPGTPPPVSPTR